ncbi:hypothetical protein [Winogradskyella sp. PG-2]|uniref:hypothetical protein n=1 Tax=Winogradskyella sp. PG-2 TaxID=754409 RepID=UPI0004587623|nr:hypothetical protein [Winogradskyella sp. PG-2]BAO74288.1 hypothetical protein WPG_0058 [Winogradskyella sp. PG-2]
MCSNNSKNGSLENFEITNRLFIKIFSDFNIDANRIYTSGFSGGARLAFAITVVTNKIQGVIACGAGFSASATNLSTDHSFSYAGIIGDEDMNLIEMNSMRVYLSQFNISNSLFTYEMNHKWPSQEQILSAFDWLQLEAYRKGIIPLNNDAIKTSYQNYYNKAIQIENDNKLLYAEEEYKRIIKSFETYYQIDSISNRLSDLSKNKVLIGKKKQLESIYKEETNLSNVFAKRFANDLTKKNKNLKWWTSRVNKLTKEEAKSTILKKKMIRCLLFKVYALAIESAKYGSASNDKDKSIFCYDICMLLYPDYSFLYFEQIENYIDKNDINSALNYVEKLLNSGYKNKSKILNYKAFEILKKK